MHFLVSSSALLKNLSIVSGIVNANTVLPILEDFLFELSGSDLTITGSDLETMIKVKMEVQAEDDNKGRVCIPSKILLEYLKNLPEQPVRFLVNEYDNSIELSSNTGKYKIGGEKTDEFPKEQQNDNSNNIKIPAGVLLNAIAHAIIAVSNDSIRPAMTGVLFEFTPECTTFVATDAHRLVKYEREDIISTEEGSIIAPRKSLQQLKSILPSDDQIVEISFNENYLFVNFAQVSVSCRLIDAKFPPYRAVIPADNPYKLTVNRADLISTLRRVSIFASKGTSQVVFDIVGNTLSISGQDIDFSYEGNETLNCQYNGEDMKIAFNAKLLVEMLNNISGDDVLLELSMPSRAGIFRPTDKNENEDLLMLIMPLLVGIN